MAEPSTEACELWLETSQIIRAWQLGPPCSIYPRKPLLSSIVMHGCRVVEVGMCWSDSVVHQLALEDDA